MSDHDRMNGAECSEKFSIPWGRGGLGAPITEEYIKRLKEKLTKKAGSNVISDYFTPVEHRWMEENLDNAHIKLFSQNIDNSGLDWLIIGVDETTVEDYASKI